MVNYYLAKKARFLNKRIEPLKVLNFAKLPKDITIIVFIKVKI